MFKKIEKKYISHNLLSALDRRMVLAMATVTIAGGFGMCIGNDVSAAENPAYTIVKGKSATINTIIKKNPLTAENFTKIKAWKLQWKAAKKKIVKVISNKKIKGLKKGISYVYGYKGKTKKVKLKVTVGKKVTAIKVTSTKVSIVPGETVSLGASVSPSSASNKKMFFVSSNPRVVTATKSGKIKGISSGSATVKVISKDGRKTKTVKVTVQSELVKKTSKGYVKGIENVNYGILSWYGVPYGADTSGKNRWRAPQEVSAWSGIKDATKEREGAAQYCDGTTYTGTEDCLYVNIQRPNTNKTNLPVLVFLHGGGNASGDANTPFDSFVDTANCVVVSVEYRLGAFGYLSHPALRDGTAEENSGNFALLDIKAALKWVQDEIGNFGGNKNNVTLSGFSAGGRNALLATISPIMKGLFHKVIIFNGGCNICTNDEGDESCEGKLANVLVNRGQYETKSEAKTYLKSLSNGQIREIFDSLTTAEIANMYRSPALKLTSFPHGFNDGVVIPKDGFEVIEKGDYINVPMLLGSDASEFSSYAWSGSLTSGNLSDLAEITSSDQMFGVIKKGVKYGSMLQSEHYIEKVANQYYKNSKHANLYAYRFKWGTDAGLVGSVYSDCYGAYHGMSKDFLRGKYFNNFKSMVPDLYPSSNKAGRVALTTLMQKYIGNFVKSGNPNATGLANWGTWNSANNSNKIMIFNSNATKSTSAMSSEMYSSGGTFSLMKSGCTKAEYNILINSLFKDRFFMPETVPSYE
ncbi:carboxylesterase family protein [Eubacterium xylanophilum]|uniref:carboxylesterase family protein n=1 Tax=Eubacterium xylanophilum TaxID=39497 RepID=UPI00047A946A|nr:carboxylesterase family protein [Eubacterium xylanophilum]